MAQYTWKSDIHDVPQLPAHAIPMVEETIYDATTGYPQGVSILVTVTGDVVVTPLGQEADITLSAVPAYYVIPFRARRIRTASTATCVAMA